MVALLKIRPAPGVSSAADTVAWLNTTVQASLRRHANTRPLLVQHWTADARGRPICHWDVELSPGIPIPPD
jgi:hypothetical protein